MLIIVNPAAAGGRVRREWPRIEGRLRALGVDAEHCFTEAPWHASDLAEQAARRGVQRIVAVGGDGTACEAAQGLYRAGCGSLAMLPVGTGNDIARMTGVPVKLDDAIRVAVADTTTRVDAIVVNDHVVMNAIGIGLVGDINRRAARVKFIRGIAVYLVTAAISMVRYCSPRITLRTPDQEWQGAITMIAIQSGPTTGGGFRLTPKAVPDDGLLDACLVPGVGPLGRLPRLLAGMRGTLGTMDGTVELRAPWLELHHDVPIPSHLDGNQYLLQPPLTRYEVVPSAIKVVVPATAVRST